MTSFRFHPQSQVVRQAEHYLITLYTDPAEQYEQVLIRIEPDHEELFMDMQPCSTSGSWLKWQVKIPVSVHAPHTLYCFKFVYSDRQVYLHAAGESVRLPQKHYHFKIHSDAQPPEWVKQQVFYQIFPERFANGKPDITPSADTYQYHQDGRPVVQKQWGEPVAKTHSGTGATEFYGGDLIGIEQQLDYLQQLGVTALYLNPIFASPSNHKYDCVDYWQVEPHFGGNKALISLSAALKTRHMKLMLDAVVNHTSNQHPWIDFYQQGKNGAYNHPSSPYRNWYHFDNDGHYWSWKGITSLPKLNFAEPEVQQAIYSGKDAMLKHWLKPPYQIDGWRFDVAHMLGEHNSALNNAHHIRQFRNAIKQTNPQAYMIGEHFSEASQWLQGEQQDGAMNYYGFCHPVVAFLTDTDVPRHAPIHLSGVDLATWLAEARASIPFANQLAQYNLLDSHDTPRFLHLVKENRQLKQIAVTLLLTYIGVPSIYYGDEVGVTGGNDPDCRRCFPWDQDQWDHKLFKHYQSLIALRKERIELQQGDLISLAEQADIWVYLRWIPGQHSIVVVNRGPAQELTISLEHFVLESRCYLERLSGEQLTLNHNQLTIECAAQSSQILSSIEHRPAM
ncbi:maltodextrin glucosidase [Agarivorans sp. QJM3NY_33]|uniref:maltodextrin glucosidase n=1 Tax=Agarivorans sp. QJM3NY_33 TaxID=3421432 RepID=UPI003D7E978B